MLLASCFWPLNHLALKGVYIGRRVKGSMFLLIPGGDFNGAPIGYFNHMKGHHIPSTSELSPFSVFMCRFGGIAYKCLLVALDVDRYDATRASSKLTGGSGRTLLRCGVVSDRRSAKGWALLMRLGHPCFREPGLVRLDLFNGLFVLWNLVRSCHCCSGMTFDPLLSNPQL